MYKLIKDPIGGNISMVKNIDNNSFFPINAVGNIDYDNFKIAINDRTAQLEDADGVLMTAQQAIDYVKTLA